MSSILGVQLAQWVKNHPQQLKVSKVCSLVNSTLNSADCRTQLFSRAALRFKILFHGQEKFAEHHRPTSGTKICRSTATYRGDYALYFYNS